MRGAWIGLVWVLFVVAACGDDGGSVAEEPDAAPPDAAPPDAAPPDAVPAFVPRSGLYTIISENFPEQADPAGCSRAPSGQSPETFITVAAGSDTITFSLFGQSTTCLRTERDFACPTLVSLRFESGAEIRNFVTTSGTFSDEEHLIQDNIFTVECVGANCDNFLGSQSGVNEFPCTFPSASSAQFDSD